MNGTSGAVPFLRVESLHYRYAGSTAPVLSDINLAVAAGSCFGLLGPNGAGKTTLISLLTGILPLQQGLIETAGLRFPRHGAQIKELSALVPQDYAFYPALSARDNMRFFAGLYRIPASELANRLDHAIAVCGLENVLDQRAATYSGGVKRRLNLAIGLLSNPQILYLDEPTVGIDAQSRHFILDAIGALKASGMTIVYTSHYMEEVEQICDQAAIIDHGRVLLHEPMEVLLRGGRQLLLTPRSLPSAAMLSALSRAFGAEWDGTRIAFNPPGQQAISPVLAEVERLGIEIDKLQMGSHKLEEVYLSATRPALRQ